MTSVYLEPVHFTFTITVQLENKRDTKRILLAYLLQRKAAHSIGD